MQSNILKEAEDIQKKLISMGFTWSSHEQAKSKLYEEVDELYWEIENKSNQNRLEDEFGDCLFSLINIGCRLNLNAEHCLENAILKFKHRVAYLELRAEREKLSLKDVSIDRMLEWWKEAKLNDEKTD